MPSLACSVPKPLKVPSLARSMPEPLKVHSLARSVQKPLKMPTVRTARIRQKNGQNRPVDSTLVSGAGYCVEFFLSDFRQFSVLIMAKFNRKVVVFQIHNAKYS